MLYVVVTGPMNTAKRCFKKYKYKSSGILQISMRAQVIIAKPNRKSNLSMNHGPWLLLKMKVSVAN